MNYPTFFSKITWQWTFSELAYTYNIKTKKNKERYNIMKKKLLLSSVAALTLFAAYNTANAADYVRTEPGIKYGPDYSNPNNHKNGAATLANGTVRTVAEVSGVFSFLNSFTGLGVSFCFAFTSSVAIS